MMIRVARRLVVRRCAVQIPAARPPQLSTHQKGKFQWEHQKGFDYDDYDHRALEHAHRVPEQAHSVEHTKMTDIDDYDHRNLQTPAPPPTGSDATLDIDDQDRRVRQSPPEEYRGDVDDEVNEIMQKQPGTVLGDPIQYAARGYEPTIEDARSKEPAEELKAPQEDITKMEVEDIDDYDHRILDKPLTTQSKLLSTAALAEEEAVTAMDQQEYLLRDPIQYAALGYVTIQRDTAVDDETREKFMNRKKNLQEKEDFVRHHGWE